MWINFRRSAGLFERFCTPGSNGLTNMSMEVNASFRLAMTCVDFGRAVLVLQTCVDLRVVQTSTNEFMLRKWSPELITDWEQWTTEFLCSFTFVFVVVLLLLLFWCLYWCMILLCYLTDDGALSWEEFKSFFSDGILSSDDLCKLFHDIDTHNTK